MAHVITSQSSLQTRRVAHRAELALVGALSASIIGAAWWYGTLDSSHGRVTLKLFGAMTLAGAALVDVVLAARLSVSTRSSPTIGAVAALPPVVFGVVVASMMSAVVHIAVIDQHLKEYWLYGWFFVVVGVAQIVWALWFLATPTRWLALLGAAGNAAIAAVWIVSRTYGSLLGPEAATAAKVGFGDVVSTALEGVVVVGCLLWARAAARRARSAEVTEPVNVVIALAAVLVTTVALYSAVQGQPFVSHVG